MVFCIIIYYLKLVNYFYKKKEILNELVILSGSDFYWRQSIPWWSQKLDYL